MLTQMPSLRVTFTQGSRVNVGPLKKKKEEKNWTPEKQREPGGKCTTPRTPEQPGIYSKCQKHGGQQVVFMLTRRRPAAAE